MCTLISMSPQRPLVLQECAPQIVPSLIVLFEGLKRAYAEKAQEQDEEDEDEEDEEGDEEVLSSDEDELNEGDAEYLEKLQEKVKNKKVISPFTINSVTIEDDASDEDSDEDYAPPEETVLESYTTPLDEENCIVDEYVAFKEILQSLQAADPVWYNALTAHLTAEQQKSLQDIMVLADQRKAAAESKRIEQSGGYAFVQHTIPTSFNFGGTPLGR
ncbi:hypothetical protein J6590_021310 [Homalodisca vitripennis]|nr:hypothetical protein J6590_021310 [Homalodisca vitripennis]